MDLPPRLGVFLDRCSRPHQDAAAACFVGLAYAVATADDPGGGKSGPGTISRRSSTSMSGLRMTAMVASTISRKLWGGMLVAIPTAMPEAPLISRLGSRVGRTVGSVSLSS